MNSERKKQVTLAPPQERAKVTDTNCEFSLSFLDCYSAVKFDFYVYNIIKLCY